MAGLLIKGAVLSGLIFVLCALGAAAAPPPPFSPYGTVTVDGASAPPGTQVTAWCDGVDYRSTATTMYEGRAWYFNLDVPGDDPETPGQKEGCYPGETVSFTVSGRPANETAPWSSSGPRLDLTVGTRLWRVYLPLVVRG